MKISDDLDNLTIRKLILSGSIFMLCNMTIFFADRSSLIKSKADLILKKLEFLFASIHIPDYLYKEILQFGEDLAKGKVPSKQLGGEFSGLSEDIVAAIEAKYGKNGTWYFVLGHLVTMVRITSSLRAKDTLQRQLFKARKLYYSHPEDTKEETLQLLFELIKEISKETVDYNKTFNIANSLVKTYKKESKTENG